MTSDAIIDIITSLGFPIATLIFLAWKGIPYLKKIEDNHRAEMREALNEYEDRLDKKEEKLDKTFSIFLENNKESMKVIEANTRAIMSLSSDVSTLKEHNEGIKRAIERNNELYTKLTVHFNNAH